MRNTCGEGRELADTHLLPVSTPGLILTMDLKADSDDMDFKRPAPIEVFASRSTLHGISHMFTYERMCIKRSLWILFFLGSLGVLVLVCVDRVQLYFQYPHVTKLDEVAAPMMVFPSVTFCNLNSFRFSRVTRNDLSRSTC
ncbi:Amiloride-sensitive cation channel 2 neuronal ' [Scophthalmus maximus]|uniref:Amiloride-sensitive cation channel 2 neuronal n=1 Tax=Scophthalmus maximus TaxID=52904 RepID=A0A2U9BES5_SCOMX|nr:Amiloride-sensitive cation channel 2 neuronal ' [Scophthalmus maximus]